jgi:hypothetical protein
VKYWKVLWMGLLLAGLALGSAGCSDSEKESDFTGTWLKYYQWTGRTMGTTTLFMSDNGSFTTTGGFRGIWSNNGKQVTLQYVTGTAVYSGRMVRKGRIEGTMVDSRSGSMGTFWMDKM